MFYTIYDTFIEVLKNKAVYYINRTIYLFYLNLISCKHIFSDWSCFVAIFQLLSRNVVAFAIWKVEWSFLQLSMRMRIRRETVLILKEDLNRFKFNALHESGRSRDGAVVRVLASHRCGPGSIPGPGVTCGLSLLLVLIPAPRVFLRVLRFSSLHKNQHF